MKLNFFALTCLVKPNFINKIVTDTKNIKYPFLIGISFIFYYCNNIYFDYCNNRNFEYYIFLITFFIDVLIWGLLLISDFLILKYLICKKKFMGTNWWLFLNTISFSYLAIIFFAGFGIGFIWQIIFELLILKNFFFIRTVEYLLSKLLSIIVVSILFIPLYIIIANYFPDILDLISNIYFNFNFQA